MRNLQPRCETFWMLLSSRSVDVYCACIFSALGLRRVNFVPARISDLSRTLVAEHFRYAQHIAIDHKQTDEASRADRSAARDGGAITSGCSAHSAMSLALCHTWRLSSLILSKRKDLSRMRDCRGRGADTSRQPQRGRGALIADRNLVCRVPRLHNMRDAK